ncbi:MAG: carbohydrate kinase family protein [Actinomycetota bacterium]|nr:carbohydrate kinase family protein [Actinomycetota bacterium]
MLCVLGDLLLDVVVRLERPIEADADTYGQIRAGAGGQAANVAAWTVALGGAARMIAKRGRDCAGRIVADELERRGVELAGPGVEGGTGTVVSVATPDGRRTMLTDRGIASDLREDELEGAWLSGCDHLHLPGYSLARAPIRGAARAAADEIRRHGGSLSVDLSSTTAIREASVPRFRQLLADLGPDVVLANADEAELVGSVAAETVVVKLGRDGCEVRRRGREVEAHAALAADVVDTTGAGDAFAAGFLLSGPELALAAAARCVAGIGAMP